MSFLDSVSVPAGAQPTVRTTSSVKPGGSFLSGIRQPTATSSNLAAHNSQVNAAAQVSKANADYANSIPGFAANFGKAAWNASGIPDQFSQGVEQAKENLPTWAGGTAEGHQGPLQAAESALGAGSGVATALFSPLAPVFKPLGAGIQAAGEALSNTPSARAYGAKYANLPANQKTGAERVIGGIANAANIAGAVLGGVEAFTPKVKGGFLESTKLPVESDTAEHPVNISKPDVEKPLPPAYKPVRLPQASHADYAKSQGYEPYTPDDKLPTIKMGPKADNGLPSIQTEAKAERGVPGDLRYEPIKPNPIAQAHSDYVKAQAAKAPKPEASAVATEKSPATPRARTTPAERIPETVRANLTEGGTHPLVNGTNARPYYERMMRGAGMTDAQIKSVLDRTATNSIGKYDAQDVLDSITDHNLEAKANGAVNPDAPSNIIKPVEGSGDYHTAGSATKVDAALVKAGLHDVVKDLPGYNSENWDHQGDFATDVINTQSKQDMIDTLETKKALPEGLLGSAYVEAAKQLVIKTGDGELNLAVRRSPLHLQVSRGAQELGYLGHLTNDATDPVRAVENVEKEREASHTVQKDTNIVKSQGATLTKALKESAPTKDAWASFVKDISCNY